MKFAWPTRLYWAQSDDQDEVTPPPSVVVSRIAEKHLQVDMGPDDEVVISEASPARIKHPGSETNVEPDRG